MMKKLSFALLAAATAAACGSSPTAPATTTVAGLAITGAPPHVGTTAQLTATATMSDGTARNVTAEAVWSSSDDHVASVVAGGLVTGVSTGSVDISAGYQGRSTATHVTITAPKSLTFTVSGFLTDGTSGAILSRVTVQLTNPDGTMQSSQTDDTGFFLFSGIKAGTVTLSVSTVDYSTVTKQVDVSSDMRVDIVLPRTPLVLVTDTFSGRWRGAGSGPQLWGVPIVIHHAGPVDVIADIADMPPPQPGLYGILMVTYSGVGAELPCFGPGPFFETNLVFPPPHLIGHFSAVPAGTYCVGMSSSNIGSLFSTPFAWTGTITHY